MIKFAKRGIKILIVILIMKYGFLCRVGGWQNYPTCIEEHWH